MPYYTGIFLVGADWFGVSFPKLRRFSGIFWVLPIDYSLYQKMILGIFLYLFFCKFITTKVNFLFYKQYIPAVTRLIFEVSFWRKILASFFGPIIPLHIEKSTVEILCKVLEMELKTYTPVGPKSVFEKIKFKVLHCSCSTCFDSPTPRTQ